MVELAEQEAGWGAPRPPLLDRGELSPGADAARLWEAMEHLLAWPSRRLVVYGTLAPGKSNHWVVKPLSGRWLPARIQGTLGWWGTIPHLTWSLQGQWLPVQVFCSQELPNHWDRIDQFEGSAYLRVLIPAWIGSRLWPCYVYHARHSWPPRLKPRDQ